MPRPGEHPPELVSESHFFHIYTKPISFLFAKKLYVKSIWDLSNCKRFLIFNISYCLRVEVQPELDIWQLQEQVSVYF